MIIIVDEVSPSTVERNLVLQRLGGKGFTEVRIEQFPIAVFVKAPHKHVDQVLVSVVS